MSTILVAKKLQPIFQPALKMDNVPLKEQSNHRHLGTMYYLLKLMYLAVHIETISNTTRTRFNLLRTLKFNAYRQALAKMLTAYVRPCLNTVTLYGTIGQTSAKK